MGNIGMGELVVIFLIILLLFGTKRLPEIGGALGKAIKEFKRAAKDLPTAHLPDGQGQAGPPAGEAGIQEEVKEPSQDEQKK